MVLYPMFVHMYLELVYKGSEKEGRYYIKKSNNLGCAVLHTAVHAFKLTFKCFVMVIDIGFEFLPIH